MKRFLPWLIVCVVSAALGAGAAFTTKEPPKFSGDHADWCVACADKCVEQSCSAECLGK